MIEPERPPTAEERAAQRSKDTAIILVIAAAAGLMIAWVLWYLHIFEQASG